MKYIMFFFVIINYGILYFIVVLNDEISKMEKLLDFDHNFFWRF